jgi:hypothetical protein
MLTVSTLASGYLENNNGHYVFKSFKEPDLQLAPITEMLKFDFNRDGQEDIMLAGNYFGVTPYHGKFDSFAGAVIQNNGEYVPAVKIGVNFANKAVKGLNIINFDGLTYLLVTINNKEIELYEIPN